MEYTGVEILEALKLTSYYPSKLTYHEATTLSKEDFGESDDYDGLTIVKRLLKFDHAILEEFAAQIDGTNKGQEPTCQTDSPTRFDFQKKKITRPTKLMHPMDVLMLLLNCCDDLLRQILVDKLVSAKLSIPILLLPINENLTESIILNRTLRSLVSELVDSAEKTKHLLTVTNPIISFIRIGDLHRSKSQLLNSFLSKSSHSAFYHRGCKNGSAKRGPSNGGIEVAWFQSTGTSVIDYEFNCNFFTILNLRGDARDFPMQLKLLCESSSLVVIMTDSVDELSKLSEQVSLTGSWTGGKLLIAIVSENSHACSNALQTFSETNSLSKHLFDITADANDDNPMHTLEWRSKIREIIGAFMKQDQPSSLSVLDIFIKKAKLAGFQLEDTDVEHDIIKRTANTFENYFREKLHSKLPIFPLQGEPVKKLAELEKMQVRDISKGNESVDIFIARLVKEIAEQRKIQCKMINEFTKCEKELFTILQHLKENDLINGLVLLKMTLGAQLANLSETIGLERVIRELGQIYEVAHSPSWQKVNRSSISTSTIDTYATIAAKLLLRGQPLEILNGEASYVPKLWIEAVFKEVAALTNNGKVFVLSVIGVQSSGKSTLLNALFGLHFPTSAGRCTRGLYCHLLPIDKTSVESDCDFVMILDAEGFRAPENAADSTAHDNEMATFIVGMSDLTIVNIEGEIWAEMEDILQIVVYALLRIKQTKKNVKYMPSCIFVHQKISAVDFREKTKEGRGAQINSLDKMVADAARKEGFSMITTFNDVVKYNEDVDLYCLPNIWNGNPPFATYNPDYCGAITSLKMDLMRRIKSRTNCLNFVDLHTRISDLWKAILKENFVFNFRCTKEALAYQSVCATFVEIGWNIRNSNLKIMKKFANKIFSLEICDDCGENEMNFRKKIEEKLQKTFREADASLEKALMAVHYEDIVDKFKGSFSKQFDDLKAEEKKKGIDSVNNAFKIQNTKLKNYLEIENTLQKIIVRLLNNAPNEKESDTFDEIWNQTFAKEKLNSETTHKNVLKRIDNSFRQYLPENEEGTEVDFNEDPPIVTEKDIKTEAIKNITVAVATATVNEACVEQFNKCKIYLESQKEFDFNESQVDTLFLDVANHFGLKIGNWEASKQRFKCDFSSALLLKEDYLAKYFTFVERFACDKLKSYKEIFIEKTDAYLCIQNRHRANVKDMILRRPESELMFAKYILQEIERVVLNSKNLIVSQILEEHDDSFRKKRAFMAKLLTDLAYKKNFSRFLRFFTKVDKFCLEELQNKIKRLLQDEAIRSKIESQVIKYIKGLVKKVKEDLRFSIDKYGDSPKKWLKSFLEKLDGKIALCPKDFLIYFPGFDVESINNTYLRRTLDHLNELDTSYEFNQLDAINDCANYFYKKLFGCCAKCPFCGAPCLRETSGHTESGKHKSLHFPVVIRGAVAAKAGWLSKWLWETDRVDKTGEKSKAKNVNLVLESCPHLIQSKNGFRTDRTVGKYDTWYHRLLGWNYINYRDYKTVFPDWHIPLLSDMKPNDNDYWKWLLVKFGAKFADKYGASCPIIDPSWSQIERKSAVESICALLHNDT